jgi:hypothetical protein
LKRTMSISAKFAIKVPNTPLPGFTDKPRNQGYAPLDVIMRPTYKSDEDGWTLVQDKAKVTAKAKQRRVNKAKSMSHLGQVIPSLNVTDFDSSTEVN